MEKSIIDNKLHVKMFGGFSMSYNGVTLLDRVQGKSQFSLLMQTILHNRKKGVSKNTLIQTLFEDRDVDDVSHSVRSIIYTAKKKLKSFGLPDVDFFRQEKNIYYWTDEIEVVEDAETFETAYYNAMGLEDPKSRLDELIKVIHLYTGRFLPNMESVVWIVKENKRIREMFKDCMEHIDLLATELQQFRELYNASAYACSVDPFSEWEVLAVKALVSLGRYDEAENYYNKTIDSYILEFGSKSTEYVREVIKDLGKYMLYQYDNIDEIQTKLKDQESSDRGGYYCPFPVFQELYRTVERVMMRSGDNIFLMLCTIVDSKGNPLQDGSKLEVLSERLSEALIRSVRHSDTVTKYGKGQYLVLLFDTNKENCSIVQRRIDSNFMIGRQRISLEYSVNKVIINDLKSLPKKQ